MRKVLISLLLSLILFCSVICFSSNTVEAKVNKSKSQFISEDKYKYIKVILFGEAWIFVFDQDDKFVEAYPESCGPLGGH